MADNIKASSRSVAGVPTRLEVNTDTGAANLYGEEGIFGRTIIATASAQGNNWTVTDAFVRKYNNSNRTKLSKDQIQQIFIKKHTPTLNNDRANIINKHSPAETKTYLATKGNIPGIVDPKTNLKTGETVRTTATQDPNSGNSRSGDGGTSTSGTSGESSTSSTPVETTSAEKTNTSIPGQTAPLRYPLDIAETTQDVVKFDMLEFSPKPLTQSGTFGTGKRSAAANRTIGTTILAIPGGIKDSNSTGWGSGEMTALEAALADIALGGIEKGGTGFTESIGKTVSNIMGGSDDVKKAIASSFAGSATGIGQQLLTRTTGAVLNPNMELLFKGPTLRPFDFTFLLAPRDPYEAKAVIDIIRFFKQGMAPIRTQKNLFLKSPNTFKVTYLHRGESGEEHFGLNKFKECALLGLNVDYTPNTNYATFTDGTMVAYRLTMRFQELEPVYNDDYADQQGSIGF